MQPLGSRARRLAPEPLELGTKPLERVLARLIHCRPGQVCAEGAHLHPASSPGGHERARWSAELRLASSRAGKQVDECIIARQAAIGSRTQACLQLELFSLSTTSGKDDDDISGQVHTPEPGQRQYVGQIYPSHPSIVTWSPFNPTSEPTWLKPAHGRPVSSELHQVIYFPLFEPECIASRRAGRCTQRAALSFQRASRATLGFRPPESSASRVDEANWRRHCWLAWIDLAGLQAERKVHTRPLTGRRPPIDQSLVA